MIYIFAVSIVYTMIKEKEQLLRNKWNMIVFLFLSIIGIGLGIIYLINPYLPTLAEMLEKNMK